MALRRGHQDAQAGIALGAIEHYCTKRSPGLKRLSDGCKAPVGMGHQHQSESAYRRVELRYLGQRLFGVRNPRVDVCDPGLLRTMLQTLDQIWHQICGHHTPGRANTGSDVEALPARARRHVQHRLPGGYARHVEHRRRRVGQPGAQNGLLTIPAVRRAVPLRPDRVSQRGVVLNGHGAVLLSKMRNLCDAVNIMPWSDGR